MTEDGHPVTNAGYQQKHRRALWIINALVKILDEQPWLLAAEREVVDEAKFILITEAEEMKWKG